MEKVTIDDLKRIRDKLSFVIFALSAREENGLAFSEDEVQGCKDILSQISNELSENGEFIENSFKEEPATNVESEIENKTETESITDNRW